MIFAPSRSLSSSCTLSSFGSGFIFSFLLSPLLPLHSRPFDGSKAVENSAVFPSPSPKNPTSAQEDGDLGFVRLVCVDARYVEELGGCGFLLPATEKG